MSGQPGYSDGGRNALAGFLYQLVGVLGFKARATVRPVSGDEGLDALLEIVRNGQIEVEAFGQDAVIRRLGLSGDEDFVLVQFKFSASAPPRPIYNAEFLGIVKRLASSARSALSLGLKRADKFILVTNRPNRSGELEIPAGSEPSGKRVAAKDNGVQKTEAKLLPRRSPSRKVAQALQWFTIDVKDFEDDIKVFACELGRLESEVTRGIDRLVGSLISRSQGGCSVDVEEVDLVEAFTECRSATRITLDSLREHSVCQVTSFLNDLGHPNLPVRRQMTKELLEGFSQHAIIIIEGDGGYR
jgi:hypothetical protein